ncbi:MAG: Asp23/Gls24 family envelope stress response protein [Oscillospiraceae bacterium]|jgi:uncharacterized alkaline shock family protein YloU|nr:Asp23/Gls24 family envelope stress response protein [Oscillospiraceae bacterium]
MEHKENYAAKLRISETAVAEIAMRAISEIKEVGDIVQTNGFPGTLSKIFHLGGKIKGSCPVKIKMHGDVVEVTAYVTVSRGCKVTAVAERIQEAVKSGVQNMLGITVSRVNVHILGEGQSIAEKREQ